MPILIAPASGLLGISAAKARPMADPVKSVAAPACRTLRRFGDQLIDAPLSHRSRRPRRWLAPIYSYVRHSVNRRAPTALERRYHVEGLVRLHRVASYSKSANPTGLKPSARRRSKTTVLVSAAN